MVKNHRIEKKEQVGPSVIYFKIVCDKEARQLQCLNLITKDNNNIFFMYSNLTMMDRLMKQKYSYFFDDDDFAKTHNIICDKLCHACDDVLFDAATLESWIALLLLGGIDCVAQAVEHHFEI